MIQYSKYLYHVTYKSAVSTVVFTPNLSDNQAADYRTSVRKIYYKNTK